jgi:hypothetical protein
MIRIRWPFAAALAAALIPTAVPDPALGSAAAAQPSAAVVTAPHQDPSLCEVTGKPRWQCCPRKGSPMPPCCQRGCSTPRAR